MVAIAAALAPFVPRPLPVRASWDLADRLPPLGPFQLTERSGKVVSDRDLSGRVWIASFIFTRCTTSCPKITTAMKDLQRRLKDTGVQLVSISVDPEHDTTAVLSRYASTVAADRDRWWFLTGPKDEIVRLVRERFKLPLAPMDSNNPDVSLMDLAHSDRLVLVARGNRVAGLFNPFERRQGDLREPNELGLLVAHARQLDGSWFSRLPALNALLNAICSTLLLVALGLILTKRVRGHRVVMITALALSALFLVSYLTYHITIGGGTPFPGVGLPRLVYFTVLISHVVLAIVMVPLVLLAARRAFRRQFHRHAALARVAYPIWLYVSVTGVVVYVMLYQLPHPVISG